MTFIPWESEKRSSYRGDAIWIYIRERGEDRKSGTRHEKTETEADISSLEKVFCEFIDIFIHNGAFLLMSRDLINSVIINPFNFAILVMPD